MFTCCDEFWEYGRDVAAGILGVSSGEPGGPGSVDHRNQYNFDCGLRDNSSGNSASQSPPPCKDCLVTRVMGNLKLN